MDRRRNLLAVLFVAYALGAGVAVSRMSWGATATPVLGSSVVLDGLSVAVATCLVVACALGGVRLARGVARASTGGKLSIALSGAIAGFAALALWAGRPYAVRGERWIPSPAGGPESELLLGGAVALALLGAVALGWSYLGRSAPTDGSSTAR